MHPGWLSLLILFALGRVAQACNQDFQERFRQQTKDACTKGTDFSRGASRVRAQVGRRLVSCLILELMGDHDRRKRSVLEMDDVSLTSVSGIMNESLINDNRSEMAMGPRVLSFPMIHGVPCVSGSGCGELPVNNSTWNASLSVRVKRSPEPRRRRPPPTSPPRTTPRTPQPPKHTETPRQPAPTPSTTTSAKPTTARAPSPSTSTTATPSPTPAVTQAAKTSTTPPPSSSRAVTSNESNRQNKTDDKPLRQKNSTDSDVNKISGDENVISGISPDSKPTDNNRDSVSRVASSSTTAAPLTTSSALSQQNKTKKNNPKSPEPREFLQAGKNDTVSPKTPGRVVPPKLPGFKTPSFSANFQSWIYQYLAQILLSLALGCSAMLACVFRFGRAGCYAICTCSCCRKSAARKKENSEVKEI